MLQPPKSIVSFMDAVYKRLRRLPGRAQVSGMLIEITFFKDDDYDVCIEVKLEYSTYGNVWNIMVSLVDTCIDSATLASMDKMESYFCDDFGIDHWPMYAVLSAEDFAARPEPVHWRITYPDNAATGRKSRVPVPIPFDDYTKVYVAVWPSQSPRAPVRHRMNAMWAVEKLLDGIKDE
jgi:hypothetical protein